MRRFDRVDLGLRRVDATGHKIALLLLLLRLALLATLVPVAKVVSCNKMKYPTKRNKTPFLNESFLLYHYGKAQTLIKALK